MRPAYDIVLRALEMGLPVELKGQTYMMGETQEGHDFIGIPMTKNNTEEFLADSCLTVNDFLRLCKSLSQDELLILAGNTALNAINRGKDV